MHSLANNYLNVHETSLVVELLRSVKPRVVLEFGVNLGKTARAILDATPSIELYIGVDLPAGELPYLACQHGEVPGNPGHFVASDPRFRLLRRVSTWLTVEDLEPVDAVFIDGGHDAETVLHDSRLARELLRPGGIIVWHDYTSNILDGVTEVLDRLTAQEHWPIQHVSKTWLAYMRNPT